MQLPQVSGPPHPFHDLRSTSILQVHKVPSQFAQHHLSLGGRGADDGIQRLLDQVQASERHSQAHAILEVGQCARDTIEEDANRSRPILLEALREVVGDPVMPQQTLMGQAPAMLILPEHVLEDVRVQSDISRAYSEHHAEKGRW